MIRRALFKNLAYFTVGGAGFQLLGCVNKTIVGTAKTPKTKPTSQLPAAANCPPKMASLVELAPAKQALNKSDASSFSLNEAPAKVTNSNIYDFDFKSQNFIIKIELIAKNADINALDLTIESSPKKDEFKGQSKVTIENHGDESHDLNSFTNGIGIVLYHSTEFVNSIRIQINSESVAKISNISVIAEKELPQAPGSMMLAESDYLPPDFRTLPKGIKIIPRAAWSARPPKKKAEKANWKCIVLHHSYAFIANAGQAESHVRSYQISHMDANGWSDIGYNFLVGPDGRVFEGREGGKNAQGAHTLGFNQHTVGINVMGNYESTAKKVSLNTPNDAQVNALANLIAWLSLECNIDLNSNIAIPGIKSGVLVPAFTTHRFMGENHIESGNGTACPGDLMTAKIPEMKRKAILNLSGTPAEISANAANQNPNDCPSSI